LIGPGGLLLEDAYLFPLVVSCLLRGTPKSNKRLIAGTITGETKRKAKKRPKDTQPHRNKTEGEN
jgi:hypothetical protein